MRCHKCGKQQAAMSSAGVVLHCSESGTSRSYEFQSIELRGLCEDCLKEQAKKKWRQGTVGKRRTVGVFFVLSSMIAAYFGFARRDISFVIDLRLAAALLLAAAIAVFIADRIFCVKEVRKSSWKALAGPDRYASVYSYFVPLGEGYYKDEQSFGNVNRGLADEYTKQLYQNLIVSGQWKDIVTAAGAVQAAQTGAPQSAPSGEPVSDDDFIDGCVSRLLAVYGRNPGGFLSDSPAAEPVKDIGRELDERGGFDMMMEAHRRFSARNTLPGLARNLEMVWDGIGGWRG